MSDEKIFPKVLHPLNPQFYLTISYEESEREYSVKYTERRNIGVVEKLYSFSPKVLSRDIKKIQKAIYKLQASVDFYDDEQKKHLIKALKLLKEQCMIYETDW